MTPLRLLRIARLRWRSLRRPSDLDGELDREIAFHFDQLVREYVNGGLAPSEARRAARLALGNVTAAKEFARDHRRVAWLEDARQDVRHGWRHLRLRPLFAAIAVGSLALGIGANAAVLTTIDVMLWRQPPIPHAERLVVMRTRNRATGIEHDLASVLEYRTWRSDARAFEAVEGWFGGARDFGTDGTGRAAERIESSAVTPEWFSLFGVQPLLGRLFTEDEHRVGHPAQVMVISHRLWKARYGLDPDIIGKVVPVNGAGTAIVGVMPANFGFQDRRVQCWFPLRLNSSQPPTTRRLLRVIGRVRDGTTVEQAQAELDLVSARLAGTRPETDVNWQVRARPIGEALGGWARLPLWTLQVAVALVLAVAGANVAALLLAQNASRRQEVALRMALGAGRGRVVRQLLAEHLPVTLASGVAGIAVAWVSLRALTFLMSPPIGAPPFASHGLTAGLSGLVLVAALVVGALVGVPPALAASRAARPAPGRTAFGAMLPFRMRGVLVAAQMAAVVVLLMAAGLLGRSFEQLATRDLGFDQRNLVGFHFRAAGRTPVATLGRIQEALLAVPGVTSSAGSSDAPLNTLVLPTVAVTSGGPAARGNGRVIPRAKYFLVTPGFFSTMGTPLRQGREFTPGDGPSAPWRVVVNETAARRLWPGASPIGRHVAVEGKETKATRQVIGVVADVPLHRWQIEAQPVVYASYLQEAPSPPGPFVGLTGRMTFVARHEGDPDAIARAAQQLVAAIDPNRPLVYSGPVGQPGVLMQEYRNYTIGLTLLAAVAALLAAMGLYGILAHAVGQRRQEIGIRLALGAGRRAILRLLARPVLTVIGPGVVAGVAGALTLPRLISGQLWNVTPDDPLTLAGVLLVSGLVVLVACLKPALRAVAIDPAVTLRAE